MVELKFPEMDMPKCCGDCFFNRQGADTWKCTAAYPVRWKDFGSPLEKPDWCPLEESKHGEWKNDVQCSECGWYMEDDVTLSPCFVGFNYCPNCGAKMS